MTSINISTPRIVDGLKGVKAFATATVDRVAMDIRIIEGKNGGFFIGLPSYKVKRTGAYQDTVYLDPVTKDELTQAAVAAYKTALAAKTQACLNHLVSTAR